MTSDTGVQVARRPSLDFNFVETCSLPSPPLSLPSRPLPSPFPPVPSAALPARPSPTPLRISAEPNGPNVNFCRHPSEPAVLARRHQNQTTSPQAEHVEPRLQALLVRFLAHDRSAHARAAGRRGGGSRRDGGLGHHHRAHALLTGGRDGQDGEPLCRHRHQTPSEVRAHGANTLCRSTTCPDNNTAVADRVSDNDAVGTVNRFRIPGSHPRLCSPFDHSSTAEGLGFFLIYVLRFEYT